MAVFFVLGPGQWKVPKKGPTPLTRRRQIADRLERHGHVALLLEEIQDRKGDQDLVHTFTRILNEEGVTDAVVYHPPQAKMQATLHELLLLVARSEHRPVPRVWLLVHHEAASLDGFHFTLKEPGLGSRYLDAIYRLRPRILPWKTAAQLDKRIDHVAREV